MVVFKKEKIFKKLPYRFKWYGFLHVRKNIIDCDLAIDDQAVDDHTFLLN